MQNQYEVIVNPEEVEAVIKKGAEKGWGLADSETLEDGSKRLTFTHMALQTTAFADKPLNPNIAWLELLGFFGFLGIGYLVANRVNSGILRLVGFIVFLSVGWLVASFLTIVLIGFCMMPVLLIAQLVVPILSALQLRNELEQQS